MIAVIVPTYNRLETLQRTIESILAQTYQDIELIVVDDGSTDGTIEYLSQVEDSRLHYTYHSSNRGVHAARNTGIDVATGDYICFVDSDDTIDSDALQILLSGFENHPDVVICAAPMRVHNSNRLTGLTFSQETLVSCEDMLCHRYFRSDKACLQLIKRSAVGQHRFLAPNIDYIFFRYILRDKTMWYYPYPLATYYTSLNTSDSLTTKRRVPSARLSIERSRHISQYLNDFMPLYEKTCIIEAAHIAYGAAIGRLLAHDLRQARRWAKLRIQYLPSITAYILVILSYLPGGAGIMRIAYAGARFYARCKREIS